MDYVITVDENDRQIGTCEKMEAHRKGILHRAFSIFTVNSAGELLLQRRAYTKYHSKGLWSNTCCSHPRPGEATGDAAHRRLKEEMGFDCPLREIFSFPYRAELDTGLIENEIDHVFIGNYDGRPECDENEVAKYKYMSFPELTQAIENSPDDYTPWMIIAFKKLNRFMDDNPEIRKSWTGD